MEKKKYKKIVAIIFSMVLISNTIFLTSCTNLDTKPETSEKTKEPIKFETETAKPKSNVTILAAGDVMFHKPQINGAYDEVKGVYDFKHNFDHVKEYIESADLALVNFETTTAGEEKGFQGYPNFNTPVESIEALKYAGFDILSTANNHTLDQGKDGLINTVDTIEYYGLKNIGTYKETNQPLLIEEVNDIKIGVLSYTYGCNGMEHTLTDEME